MAFQSEYEIKMGPALENLRILADGIERVESLAQRSSKATTSGFQASAQATQDFTRELANGVKIYDTIGTSAEAFGDEIKRLSTLYDETKAKQKQFIAEGKFDQYQASIAGIKARIKELGGELEDTEDKAKDAGKALDFRKQLADGTKIFQPIENGAKSFEAELKRLNQVYKDLIKNEKQFAAEGRFDEMQQNVAGLKERAKQLGGEIETGGQKTSKFGNILKGAGTAFLGLFAAEKILETGKEIVRLTGEFEQFEAVLTNSLGSKSEAQAALFLIQDFAAKTPYSVAQLSDSYVKLTNRGIQPTRKELQALGDLAASTGKPFDQLTEAILDSVTGENERLKEFGVTARKQGETTAFTFKGTTTVVKNTSEAVKEYLVSLGKVEGVSGSMAAISNTLNGQISNLGDSWDRLLLSVGKSSGVLSGAAGLLANLVGGAADAITSTEDLAARNTADDTLSFIEKQTQEFKVQIRSLQKSGADIQTAVAEAVTTEQDKLKGALQRAHETADAVEKAAATLAAVGGVGGMLTRRFNREPEIAAEEEVARIQGQIDGLASAAQKAQALIQKEDDAAQAEAAKKAAEAAKKAKAAREKAIKDYAADLLRLEKEANKARLDMMDKDSEEYIEAVRKNSQKEIDVMVAELEKKDKAAGGDGKLSAKAKGQVQILRDSVQQKYMEDIVNLAIKTNDKIFDLQTESDQKELDALAIKFEKEITAARHAKNERLAIALEQAQKLQEAALVKSQALAKVDRTEQISLNQLTTGEDPTVANQTKAATAEFQRRRGFLAKLFDLEVNAENELQKARLRVQIDANNKRLTIYDKDLSEEGKVIASNLKAANVELTKQLTGIKDKSPKLDILELLGVADEDKEQVKNAMSQFSSIFLGNLSEILAGEVELANQRVSASKDAVEEKQNDLNTEIELNKLGFASNVETKREELKEAKKIRAEALADQKKAQRAQQILETVSQTIGLITASVDVLKGFAQIPIIGLPLGIAAVGLMFGSFIAAKSKAASLTKAEKGTVISGRRHSGGGEKFYHESGQYGYELEEGERVINRNSSRKYEPMLVAINNDDEARLRQLAADLEGTGVSLSREPVERSKMIQATAANRRSAQTGTSPKLEEISAHLKQISENTAQRDRIEYDTAGNRVEISGNHRRTIRKRND
jgi:hypothetical protein